MSTTRYFTASEVAAHNIQSDCWISYLGEVYNLTPLCNEFAGDVLLKPIVANAGKDISHWFNKDTRDLKIHVDVITGCTFPYTPVGRFVHVPPPCPRSDWANNFGKPWWKDEKYHIGVLSKKTRHIRIINTLTLEEQTVEVCAEETMEDILKRYLPYNSHANSYMWKYFGKNLDMKKTLLDNGVEDESEDFFELRMDEDEFLPPISLYFNDDLTQS